MASIDTLIVNYRTPELTAAAARSVLSEPETHEVVIIDNASGDGSAEHLQRELVGERVRVLALDQNLGFGAGNNAGAATSEADYLFFLNSDAALRVGGLGSLLRTLNEPNVGIVAPRVCTLDGQEQLDSYGVFPTPRDLLLRRRRQPENPLAPPWVSGVAFLTRRRDFETVGGFDEGYFMYLEDVDLCFRYRAAGLGVLRVPEAEVTHIGGGSRHSSREQKSQYDRSQDRFLRKAGFSPLSRRLVRFARALYRLLRP
ncbi:MAG TPA: glycosyltransferase family 2 protein [Fimbriimonadaceae bacterium]|nr:glycosyltransferase family 2 protein [Fimbriimonadaceae bacterium]